LEGNIVLNILKFYQIRISGIMV